MKSSGTAPGTGAKKSTSGGKEMNGKQSNGSKANGSKTNNAAPKKSSSNEKKSEKKESDVATGLRDLMEEQIKDIYWAEKALTKALPKMAKKATSEELVNAINDHLEVTMTQIQRLEQIFEIMGKPAKAKKCDAMEGLIKEGEGIMEETAQGVVRDAGIIAASQKIEHYEIASYGTLFAFATTLGEDEIAGLLEETLNEEKEADATLTQVAESAVNIEAAEGDDDEDDADDSEEDDEK